MFRCWVLFEHIIDELLDAAEAMADGSYWFPRDDGNARDHGAGFNPHGDGG